MKRGIQRAWLAGVAGLLVVACHKDASEQSGAASKVPDTPVPAPEGLVADVVVRGPDALWGRLRQGVAGPLARLPQSIGGAFAAAGNLDLTLAGEVDGSAPAYAVVAHPGATFGWAAAMKVRDIEHARTALLGGKAPRFVGRTTGGGLTVLGSAPGGASTPGYLLALSPLGYLVVAGSEGDLVTLSPYATRTLPARPPSAHALLVSAPHGALSGAIHDELLYAVADMHASASMLDAMFRKQQPGKAPELGDPGQVIRALDEVARQKVAVLADLDRAELSLDATDDEVDLELSLTPGTGVSAKSFAGLPTGAAAPMLSLSAETEAAVLFLDDPSSIRDTAKTIEEATASALKPKLSAKEAAALHDAMSRWTGARGPWLTAGVELEGGPALTIRTPTSDPDSAMQAVTHMVDLAHLPAFHKMLEARFAVQGVSTATAAATGVGSTSIATFRRAGAAADAELAIAWATTGEILHVAAAETSARALRASKDPTRLLGADARLSTKLGTLRDRAAFVFAERLAFTQDPGAPRSSMVLGVGRDKANGWAMLEVDDAILREALRRSFEASGGGP